MNQPSNWARFRGGFIQAWRNDQPDTSTFGKAQAVLVAGALTALVLVGLPLGVFALYTLMH